MHTLYTLTPTTPRSLGLLPHRTSSLRASYMNTSSSKFTVACPRSNTYNLEMSKYRHRGLNLITIGSHLHVDIDAVPYSDQRLKRPLIRLSPPIPNTKPTGLTGAASWWLTTCGHA
jgi:hypothetical protein